MLTAEAMRKLRIVVIEHRARHVAEVLGRLGVLHLRSSVDEGDGRLEPEDVEQRAARRRELRARLDALAARLGTAEETPEDGDAAAAPVTGLPEVEALVDSVEGKLAERTDALATAEQALADTEEIVRGLAPFRTVRSALERLADSDLLETRTGVIGAGKLDAVREGMPDGVLLVPLDEDEAGPGRPLYLLALSGRRRRFAMETVLGEQGFEDRHVPAWQGRTPADVYEEAVRKRAELRDRIASLRGELLAMAEPYGAALGQAAASLSVHERLDEAERMFGTTWATVVMSGWAPEDRVDELRRAVLEATGGQAVIEAWPPDPEEIEQGRVPSYVEHPAFLAPFAGLVRGYGVASYTEIEPTVMFAVTFLLMFGLIFGDVGHGLCLVAIGLLVKRLSRGAAARDIGHVIAACGGASILFGTFVQGSLFGKSLADMGFPLTLGFEPIRFEGEGAGGAEHVVRYLALAMALGVALISFGVLLNVVNRLRRGDYEGGLLGRFGVTGIILYWGLLGLGIKCVVAGPGAADLWPAAALLAVPLAVLILHEPLHELLAGKEPIDAGGLIMGLFQGVIEAMETLMTYVANTLSFLRVAAFALSHAALCLTIFILQRLVVGLPGGPLWSAAIFVLGTAVIIGLEGLIVAIQILRLEYYEFFTKFFQAEGVRYKPFRLE